jgi:predicted N-acyltransferase
MQNISIKTASSIHEIDPVAWDQLSNGHPFQSHRWYVYGERVMTDCPPYYVLAYDGNHLVARASFWLVRNEPVPKMLGPFRKAAQMTFSHWPLLICRSPLSHTRGFVSSDEARQAEIIPAFAESALDIAKGHSASFILFDYLSKKNIHSWPQYFSVMSAPHPGMKMENNWKSLDEYLAAGSKKDRQHYKRVLREAEKLGLEINRHSRAGCIDEALPLIRNVENRYGAFPNPWAREMLEHMEMVNGSFLTATMKGQLVGCGLLLEDNKSQMTSVLGRAEGVPYVYFMLVYESLKIAFEHNVRLLRWGSGADEIKQRLGFSPEDNSYLSFAAVHPFLRKMLRWVQ